MDCYECAYTQCVRDNNGKLHCLCINVNSENFLAHISCFDICECFKKEKIFEDE